MECRASIFFVVKMLSAFYVCCKYSSAFQTFFPWSKHYNPRSDKSDLGPYCLQFGLPRREEHTTKSYLAG